MQSPGSDFFQTERTVPTDGPFTINNMIKFSSVNGLASDQASDKDRLIWL